MGLHLRGARGRIISRDGVPDVVKTLVFGAGAIGSLLGGLLSIENEVTIVARKPHVDAVNRRGLRISRVTNRIAWPTARIDAPADAPDVVFITTKAYDTERAVDALRAFWRRSLFVTLQNGLGNAEALAANADRVIAGTTTHGVTFVAPGEIVHAGAGDTVVGPVKGVDSADTQHLADVLTAAGVPTTVTSDARRELWAKAVVNAAINPLTAVLRVPNGVLVETDDLRHPVEILATEGATAAADAGVPLEPSDLAAKAVEVAARTAKNRSSMLQDIEAGRRTEVDAITGALVGAAAAKGRRLPYNEIVQALVLGLERNRPAGPSPEG